MRISIKPLSVNEVWQGKRFKTKKYASYEKELLFMLPKMKLPVSPYELHFDFGVSSKNADLDNPVKPMTDILQKKYGFNDRDIYRLVVHKTIVPKGSEYVDFEIKIYVA